MSDQSFEYCVTDGHKLLPIDYSRNELGQKWDVDPRTVAKHVAHSCLLKDSLSALTKPLAGQYGNKTSFPVEAEFFLKAYFDQAQSLKLLGKNLSSGEKRKLFIKLCETLYGEICAPQGSGASILDSDSAMFYRRALFQNDEFSSYTMKQLWQTHLNLRFNQIINLAGSISAEKQAEALQDCLVALDRICLNLIQAKEGSSKNSATSVKRPSDPKELLDELLTPRKELTLSVDHYELTNSEVTYLGKEGEQTISLEAAFRKLQCTKLPDKELMKQARIVYMHDLAAHVPCSNFEVKYNHLSGYLDLFDIELDEESLTAKVINAMKQILVIEICNCYCYPPPKEVQEENIPATYFGAFLSEESEAFIKKSTEIFEDTVELVQRIATLRQQYSISTSNIPPDIRSAFEQAIYRNVVLPHIVWFVQAWAFVNHKDPAFDPEKISIFDKEDIVEITQYIQREATAFWRKGHHAVSYFGKTAESAYASSQSAHNTGAQDYVTQAINRVHSDLMLGICLIFQRVVEDLAPRVSRNIKLFQKYKLTYRK